MLLLRLRNRPGNLFLLPLLWQHSLGAFNGSLAIWPEASSSLGPARNWFGVISAFVGGSPAGIGCAQHTVLSAPPAPVGLWRTLGAPTSPPPCQSLPGEQQGVREEGLCPASSPSPCFLQEDLIRGVDEEMEQRFPLPRTRQTPTERMSYLEKS